MTLLTGATDKKEESEEGKKFKHAEARDARLKTRDAALEEKEKQVSKKLQQSQKFRDQQEVERLRVWKEAEHRRKAAIEDSRINNEEALQYAKEVAANVAFEKME